MRLATVLFPNCPTKYVSQNERNKLSLTFKLRKRIFIIKKRTLLMHFTEIL